MQDYIAEDEVIIMATIIYDNLEEMQYCSMVDFQRHAVSYTKMPTNIIWPVYDLVLTRIQQQFDMCVNSAI